jgi:hypothetical protein
LTPIESRKVVTATAGTPVCAPVLLPDEMAPPEVAPVEVAPVEVAPVELEPAEVLPPSEVPVVPVLALDVPPNEPALVGPVVVPAVVPLVVPATPLVPWPVLPPADVATDVGPFVTTRPLVEQAVLRARKTI